MNERALKQMKRVAASTAPSELKPTGQTAVINGYKAREYVAPGATGGTTHQWVTTDLPDYQMIRDSMNKGFSNSPVFQRQKEMWASMDGFPVRTEIESARVKSTITLISAEQKSLAADVFQPPADYQEMQQVAPPQQ
jgi:hypothetical protein